jgi:hypothetical protein
MAAYMTINSKCSSWKDFHLSRKKETKGFLQEPTEIQDSLLGDRTLSFVNDKIAFTDLFDLFEGEYLLLFPAGGNRVNLIHSCFKATVDAGDGGGGPSVFGILGGRMTSPFKRINIGQAVTSQAPRTTRSDDKKEVLAPSKKDFTKCKSSDEFRDLVVEPGRGDRPAELLGDLPSACLCTDLFSGSSGKTLR